MPKPDEENDHPIFNFEVYGPLIIWSYKRRLKERPMECKIEAISPKDYMSTPYIVDDDRPICRKKRKVDSCPHTDSLHYAKGMCKQCYTFHGRSKKATKCIHKDKNNYARGLCHKCYQTWYNNQVRSQKIKK